MNYTKYGYYNISLASPKISLGNTNKNTQEIIEWIKKLESKSHIIAFPELSLTGYTCGDLFLKDDLYYHIDHNINEIAKNCTKSIVIIGAPVLFQDKRYNCALVFFNGKLQGYIPKTHLCEYNEFYEKRWFSSWDFKDNTTLNNVPFGTNQIFTIGQLKLAIEICEDLWVANSPSIQHTQSGGANTIINLSASPELVGKDSIRNKFVDTQSEKTLSSYFYVSSNYTESTQDVVFGGHCFGYEMGSFLGENEAFQEESAITLTTDINRLILNRNKNQGFNFRETQENNYYIHNIILKNKKGFYKKYRRNPFTPKNENDTRVTTISKIQATGLKRRLNSIGKNTKIILGLSGGLDSTLALLVALEATKPQNIYTYSMPGPGTSNKTKNNANKLAKLTGVNFQEIDINEEVNLHLKQIQHNKVDVTYENVQARIRTLHLFNLANQKGGIVLGTGDLSEIALGWCTFNGDHMNSYNVNASVPKTLVKYLVNYYRKNKKLNKILNSILNTAISPELVPIKNKLLESTQSTEDIIGPYEFHDFILFHFIKNGYSKEKLKFMAKLVFNELDINKYLNIFFKRFKQNQFKRTVMTAGPKVGTVSLSPRGDWRMPDELDLW